MDAWADECWVSPAVRYGDATGRRPPGSQPDAGRRGRVDNPAGATQSPVSGDPTRIGSRTQMPEGSASDSPGWSGTATPTQDRLRRLAEIDQVGWMLVMMNPLGAGARSQPSVMRHLREIFGSASIASRHLSCVLSEIRRTATTSNPIAEHLLSAETTAAFVRAITLDREPSALRSTRNRLRRAMHQGCVAGANDGGEGARPGGCQACCAPSRRCWGPNGSPPWPTRPESASGLPPDSRHTT